MSKCLTFSPLRKCGDTRKIKLTKDREDGKCSRRSNTDCAIDCTAGPLRVKHACNTDCARDCIASPLGVKHRLKIKCEAAHKVKKVTVSLKDLTKT